MAFTTTGSATSKAAQQHVQKYLTFILGRKTYAVSILKVKEIMEYGLVTSIPKMPSFVCGAINLRGRVVPVIDLLQRLEDEHCEIEKRSCIIIIEMTYAAGTMNVGIIVNAVSKVIDFTNADIEAAPSFGGTVNVDFMEGMGKVGEDFIIILNIDKVLSLQDFEKLIEAHQEGHHSDIPEITTSIHDGESGIDQTSSDSHHTDHDTVPSDHVEIDEDVKNN